MSFMASPLLKNPSRNVSGEPAVALMGMFELKMSIEVKEEYERFVSQTVCYMVSALAFSRWGMLRNFDALVALLISPTSLYRPTVSKPQNAAMGLHLRIEKTTDLLMMEWVLSD